MVATSRLESYWQQQSSDHQPIAFDVSGWRDIVSVRVTSNCVLGLKADGTVVATGEPGYTYWEYSQGEPTLVSEPFDFSGWTGIVSLYYGDRYAVGLRADGTVMVTGKAGFEYYDDSLDSWEYMAFDLSHWTDIVSLYCGDRYVIGLRADGTVVTTDSALTEQVSGWQNIVQVQGDGSRLALLGLKADGTVVYADASGEEIPEVVATAMQWQDIATLRQGSGYL